MLHSISVQPLVWIEWCSINTVITSLHSVKAGRNCCSWKSHFLISSWFGCWGGREALIFMTEGGKQVGEKDLLLITQTECIHLHGAAKWLSAAAAVRVSSRNMSTAKWRLEESLPVYLTTKLQNKVILLTCYWDLNKAKSAPFVIKLSVFLSKMFLHLFKHLVEVHYLEDGVSESSLMWSHQCSDSGALPVNCVTVDVFSYLLLSFSLFLTFLTPIEYPLLFYLATFFLFPDFSYQHFY